MNATDLIVNAQRESKLVDALYLARHALATHNGLTIQCEGEDWPLDFSGELQKIDAALRMAGIDATKPTRRPRNPG